MQDMRPIISIGLDQMQITFLEINGSAPKTTGSNFILSDTNKRWLKKIKGKLRNYFSSQNKLFIVDLIS